MRRRRSVSIMLASLALLAGAAGGARAAEEAKYESLLIRDVPHIRQKPDFCGEACGAMWLRRLGQDVDQDYVFDASGLDPLKGRGCWTRELATALEQIGFEIGPVWHKVPVAEAQRSLERLWAGLHADLAAGVPSIVCTRFDQRPNTTEHFRLLLGYDAQTDEVIFHDPATADGRYRRMPRAAFLSLWPLKYDAQQWTVVVLPLRAERLTRGVKAAVFTSADYAQHVMQLKKKVPDEGFTIVIQPPFVVIGDESPQTVRQRSQGTVQWAVDRLKRAYFQKDPREILDVWLFRDEASYRKHTKQIFDYRPATPYGYYSSSEKALVMNIGTGGGTLVHEIVHPFMASNFPACPAWFNEGLGSLYEQSGSSPDGHIIGRTNWRLAGLQEAIRQQRVPTFKTLTATTDHQFYQQDRGTNYAQARYLCYYLQQHGRLHKFYRRFVANQTDDPTGYDTLAEVLAEEDMDAFQKRWEAYVLKLRFP